MRALLLLLAAAVCLVPPAAAQDGPTPPPPVDPRIHDIVRAPSAERVEADIRTLAGFGTRHTLSDTTSDTRGIGAARRWVEAEFERISAECGGCLEVETQRFVVAGESRIPDSTTIVNVYAVQRGTVHPNRYVVMSGDIDSRASDIMNDSIDAPGANDNASGLAGALEAARVLSQYEFGSSIVYAGLSGEEQGLFGGQHMAQVAREQGWEIAGVLNNDMIGNIEGQDGVIDNTVFRVFSQYNIPTDEDRWSERYFGGENDSPSRNLARYVARMTDLYVPNMDAMMIYRLDRFGRGGHHTPFNNAGFPAVRIMEAHEDYTEQHQDIRTENGIDYGDTIDEVHFDFAARMTGVNAAVLAGIAAAPPAPDSVQIGGAVQPSTTLAWSPVDDPTLAGYKVYWRATTAPQWTHSRFVGDVTAYTLENIIIDNYLFGVAAVGQDGNESPVVFPTRLLRR
jgi:Zn-dependent M28 family amino/carboxypeptidase